MLRTIRLFLDKYWKKSYWWSLVAYEYLFLEILKHIYDKNHLVLRYNILRKKNAQNN